MKKIFLVHVIALITLAGCSKKGNSPAPVPTSVVIAGTTYPIVTIGSQTFTAINYNGPGGENFNNSDTNVPADGKLYTMAEAQAITLPAGWRLPVAADYNKMLKDLGGTFFSNSTNYTVPESVALQLMSTTGWNQTQGNNQLGFNARPVGYFFVQFAGAGDYAFFLCNTPQTGGNNEPLSLEVTPGQTAVYPFVIGTVAKWTVRFVKDN